jgi:hypothetical protein
MAVVGILASGAAVAVAAGRIVRQRDERQAQAAWAALANAPPEGPARFEPRVLDGAPDPARRYLRYAIASGAALRTVAVIEIEGEFSLGTKAKPGYLPMRAREILAFPRGLVWSPVIGSGLMRFAGSDGYLDGEAWTRFWALGAAPVARTGGGSDMARSAAARMLAEAALWTPAVLLPRDGVRWEAVGQDTARVTVDHRGWPISLDIAVAPDGRPLAFVMRRWSNANPERIFREQAFGGVVNATRRFGDYTLPAEIEVGNHFGSDDYFPFFKARVVGVRDP